MRYNPSTEFDGFRVWRRMVAYFVVAACLAVSGFAYWSWTQTVQQVLGDLHVQARLTANATRSIFQGLIEDLPYLALQVHARPQALRADYRLLRAYQQHHPAVASVVLFAPDGEMQLNTARPCCTASLPDPRRHPAILKSLRDTLRVTGVWIGKTQRGLVLHRLRIPMRYVLRGPRGQPRGILQATVLLGYLERQWSSSDQLPGLALGLIRPDGLHIARLPSGGSPDLYTKPEASPLLGRLRTHPHATGGRFEGRGPDGRYRIGEYVRLHGFPIIAYASAPRTVVFSHWLRETAPFVGLALLSLIGVVGLTRRQVRYERRHALELAKRARHDVLTGLPNRFAFTEWLDLQLSRKVSTLVALRIDLDDFHDINTALGSRAGDRALQETARRIQRIAQLAGGFVAHGGGDEFDIALPGAKLVNANALAQAVMKALGAPLEIDGCVLRLQAGIGIGSYPDDASDSAELLRVVDSALYSAKHEGKSRIALYDPASGDRSNARVGFLHAIERALADNEFLLHLQPQVRMDDGRIVGVEALVRWNDPERGMVPPGEFIPLAEATGRIGAIGDWVFRRACAVAAALRGEGHDIRVSVNLSAAQFNSPDLAARLQRDLEAAGLAPGAIELEVTETAVMQDVERSLGVLRDLKALGLAMAIDDFGTGYSSLAYLRRLPAQTIKIDQSFVRDLDSDPEDLAIVRSIVALARALGRGTVAEGIESLAQWRVLRGLGVDVGQGYGLSHPLSEDELRALLRRHGGYLDLPRRAPEAAG